MSEAATPSQQIVAANAPATATLTDARGRKIGVRELTGLDQLRMLRAIGPAQSGNTDYGYMVECIMMVTDIDGVPLVQPKTEERIDAAMMKIGDEGMAAVMVWRTQRIRASIKAAEDALEASKTGDAPPAPDPLAPSAS